MLKRVFILGTLFTVGLSVSAQAQIRVDARIQTSFGSCSGCDLSKRRMNGMKLQDADFSRSLFNSSNLSGARFDRANLSGAHFRKALLLRVKGEGVNMSKANFRDATLTEASLDNSNFESSDFSRADLTRASFHTTNFKSTNFISAMAQEADFSNSVFDNARLDHVNFRKANLSGGDFKNARFGDAILLETTINGADFSGADLSGVQGLEQAQLDFACGSSATRLPFGMSVPYCSDIPTSHSPHGDYEHAHLDPQMARAAKDLDDALDTLENLLAAPPSSEKKLRRKLQAIHADISASRRAIER